VSLQDSRAVIQANPCLTIPQGMSSRWEWLPDYWRGPCDSTLPPFLEHQDHWERGQLLHLSKVEVFALFWFGFLLDLFPVSTNTKSKNRINLYPDTASQCLRTFASVSKIGRSPHEFTAELCLLLTEMVLERWILF
jgi:hypothetical protein